MKSMEKLMGVKNHNPVIFTLDFIDAKNIIERSAIKKLLFVLVFFLTIKKRISAVSVAQIAGEKDILRPDLQMYLILLKLGENLF